MIGKFNKHMGHYILLFLIFSLGLFGLLFFHSDKKFQMAFVISIALFYIVLGIIHHAMNHSLNSKIVVEYVLIGSLGIAALVFLVTGAFGI